MTAKITTGWGGVLKPNSLPVQSVNQTEKNGDPRKKTNEQLVQMYKDELIGTKQKQEYSTKQFSSSNDSHGSIKQTPIFVKKDLDTSKFVVIEKNSTKMVERNPKLGTFLSEKNKSNEKPDLYAGIGINPKNVITIEENIPAEPIFPYENVSTPWKDDERVDKIKEIFKLGAFTSEKVELNTKNTNVDNSVKKTSEKNCDKTADTNCREKLSGAPGEKIDQKMTEMKTDNLSSENSVPEKTTSIVENLEKTQENKSLENKELQQSSKNAYTELKDSVHDDLKSILKDEIGDFRKLLKTSVNKVMKTVKKETINEDKEKVTRDFLDGIIIHPAIWLKSTKNTNGFVFKNISEEDMNDQEDVVRQIFQEDDTLPDFDEIFKPARYIPSKTQPEFFDAIFCYKIKGGSADPKVKEALTTWRLSKKTEKLFGECPKELSPYRNQRLRDPSAKRKIDDISKQTIAKDTKNSDEDSAVTDIATPNLIASNEKVETSKDKLVAEKSKDDVILNKSDSKNVKNDSGDVEDGEIDEDDIEVVTHKFAKTSENTKKKILLTQKSDVQDPIFDFINSKSKEQVVKESESPENTNDSIFEQVEDAIKEYESKTDFIEDNSSEIEQSEIIEENNDLQKDESVEINDEQTIVNEQNDVVQENTQVIVEKRPKIFRKKQSKMSNGKMFKAFMHTIRNMNHSKKNTNKKRFVSEIVKNDDESSESTQISEPLKIVNQVKSTPTSNPSKKRKPGF